MRYDIAAIGSIIAHHDSGRPGYRIGDARLFDRLAEELGAKGGTIHQLVRDARAILAAEFDREVRAMADRVHLPGHPVERMIG